MVTAEELKKNFVTTSLERRLIEDNDGSTLADMEQKLSTWLAELVSRRNAGLPKNEFAQCDRLMVSIRVALQAVRRTWKKSHSN